VKTDFVAAGGEADGPPRRASHVRASDGSRAGHDAALGPRRRAGPLEGLATGRWSLVDHFDTDGRRYLVAHRNDPPLDSPNALTLPERQIAGYAAMGHSNKLIAYELGLAESTVATHLDAASLKLGVRSRADLARLFGGIVGPDGPGG
jgi:DNA-binding CsgD family transcriptional regulator